MALLWTPDTEQLCVAVVDLRSNQSFDLPVDTPRAMHLFHHPYPYAVERGLLDAYVGTEPTFANLPVQKAERLAP